MAGKGVFDVADRNQRRQPQFIRLGILSSVSMDLEGQFGYSPCPSQPCRRDHAIDGGWQEWITRFCTHCSDRTKLHQQLYHPLFCCDNNDCYIYISHMQPSVQHTPVSKPVLSSQLTPCAAEPAVKLQPTNFQW